MPNYGVLLLPRLCNFGHPFKIKTDPSLEPIEGQSRSVFPRQLSGLATLMAIRRASSFVSTSACRASASFSRERGARAPAQSSTLATRRAADDGRAFRTGEDPGLYAGFRWEYARHDPHKPHREVALRALRFAHEESSVPLHQHSSNKFSLDRRNIIHTRPCNLGVLLNTTSPGQSHRGAGASLLTAVRLPWRVDLLTRLIYVPLGDSQ